ncbi:hypothetical protein [Enterobacter hormaechei]|uniref:hypothetical protein n=1 Tax=Enterobacter hormaechei TaxID=158836 RepID=UPI0028934436|nr:hypothetical protein [Enterobacter hormaechei]WMA27131.1 hypothetical protein QPR58_04320 [Enterobacter hormaechei]WMA40374.1 hypothetical protein QPR62_04325 [Enterobacter hormaechei]
MMSLWDALRMNMMISYQELVRTFPKTTYTYTNNIMKQLGFNSLKKIYSCGEIIRESIENEIIREKKKYYSSASPLAFEPQCA